MMIEVTFGCVDIFLDFRTTHTYNSGYRSTQNLNHIAKEQIFYL